MRYSRLKRRRNGQRYITLIVTVLLISGIVYVGSAGTIGKYIGNKIAPIFSSFDKNKENNTKNEDEPVLTIPSETGKAKEKTTETIEAKPLQITAIQMGAFEDYANAQTEALNLQKSGAAGYILNDEYYRVFAMGYLDEDDAYDVRERLKEEETDSVLYTISASGASMEITASAENVETIKSAFSTWIDKFNSMEKLIIDLDTEKISPEEASDRINEYKTDIEKIEEELNKITSNHNDNKILSALAEMYSKGAMSFKNILSSNTSKLVEISSKMKYTYIDMIVLYKELMDKILNS